ncbi:transcriptional regulator [Aeromonas media]|uniref:Transcriptional regulator n=2 Tax=Aeromonadaceae TaxID=84642 RepID=A0ABX6NX81_AERME|nr:DUF3693 domain-containing protein [Aeromonas media]QJT34761.1 transcriptional regulator [Aeromonas media]QJT40344.1 transcriptional regulator [Aeromonas media]
MDSKALLAAYMRAKNMTMLKEAAEALSFTSPYLTEINKGHKQFSDEIAIFMAKEAGLDPAEVMISLHAVKAKSDEARQEWYDILKKYCGASAAALVLGWTMMAAPQNEPNLTAHNVYYVKWCMLDSCYRQLNCV